MSLITDNANAVASAEAQTRLPRQSGAVFLSQAAAGGALGSFLFLCAVLLWYPNGYNFLLIGALPFYLILGASVGLASGSIIWTSERLFQRQWIFPIRAAISVIVATTVGVAWSAAEGAKLDGELLFWFIPGAFLGLPSGVIAGSKINPFLLIAQGIASSSRRKVLFERGPLRIGRSIELFRFSEVAGLPLRAATLLGLMLCLALVAYRLGLVLWKDWCCGKTGTPVDPELLTYAIAAAYFTTSVCVSFIIRHKLVVVMMALLINIPLALWIGANFRGHVDAPFIAFSIILGFWLLFVAGLLSTHKGPLEVTFVDSETNLSRQLLSEEHQ